MRKLYTRFSREPLSHGQLLLALVKFFVKHREADMYDAEMPIALFFGDVLSAKFSEYVIVCPFRFLCTADAPHNISAL